MSVVRGILLTVYNTNQYPGISILRLSGVSNCYLDRKQILSHFSAVEIFLAVPLVKERHIHCCLARDLLTAHTLEARPPLWILHRLKAAPEGRDAPAKRENDPLLRQTTQSKGIGFRSLASADAAHRAPTNSPSIPHQSP